MDNWDALKEIAAGFTLNCYKDQIPVPMQEGFCYGRYNHFLSDGDSSDRTQIGECQMIYLKGATYAIQYHIIDMSSGGIIVDGIYVTDNMDPKKFKVALSLIKDRIVSLRNI